MWGAGQCADYKNRPGKAKGGEAHKYRERSKSWRRTERKCTILVDIQRRT